MADTFYHIETPIFPRPRGPCKQANWVRRIRECIRHDRACVRQREIERRAFADLSLGPDPATMPGHDPLDDRQTDAGSGELFRYCAGAGTRRTACRAYCMSKPAPLSLTKNTVSPPSAREPTSITVRLPTGEFDGVVQQVRPDTLKHQRIATHVRQRSDYISMARSAMTGASSRSVSWTSDPISVSEAASCLPADAGEREDIVDQLPHPGGAIPHHLQESLTLRVQLVRIILQQDIREAIDRAQRRTKIVRHGIGKGLQFLIGSRQSPDGLLQIARACRDQLLKALTMLQQRQLIAQCEVDAELQLPAGWEGIRRFLLVKPVRWAEWIIEAPKRHDAHAAGRSLTNGNPLLGRRTAMAGGPGLGLAVTSISSARGVAVPVGPRPRSGMRPGDFRIST